MLTVFANGVGYPISNDDYYIRHLASGLDEIVFNVSIRDAVFKYIVEEAIIRDRDQQEYVIKQIDAGNDKAKVVAQINIDDWKRTLYMNYSNESDTVDNTITRIAPQGWSVIDRSQKSIRRTIPTSDKAKDYNVTPWEIVTECCNTYSIRVRIDTVNKYLYIINPQLFTNIGAFATRDLNLRSLNYKGKSENFATRLYATGAEGMTFASINDGKPYVDNFTYSDKIIEAYWKDERYTDKYSLLADAQARLAEMATPSRSYDCDILDLANTNPDIYGFENFELFNIVTLIDDAQERRTDYQIVEKWEYPYYPSKNKVILSTKTPNIQTIVSSVVNAVNSPVSAFSQKIQSAMNIMTQLVTGNEGGYVVLNDSDADGYPDEILVMDTPSIATAVKVWRWNNAGLGFSSTGYNGTYTLGLNMLGQINADMITAGHLNGEVISGGSISINALSEEAKNAIAALHSYIPENVLASINNWEWRSPTADGLVSIEAVDGVNCLCLDGTGLSSADTTYYAQTKTSLFDQQKVTLHFEFMVDHTVTVNQRDWFIYFKQQGANSYRTNWNNISGTFEAGQWYTVEFTWTTLYAISRDYPCRFGLYMFPGTKRYIKNLTLTSTLDSYATASLSFTDSGLKLLAEEMNAQDIINYLPYDVLENAERAKEYGSSAVVITTETITVNGVSKKALCFDATSLEGQRTIKIPLSIVGRQSYDWSIGYMVDEDITTPYYVNFARIDYPYVDTSQHHGSTIATLHEIPSGTSLVGKQAYTASGKKNIPAWNDSIIDIDSDTKPCLTITFWANTKVYIFDLTFTTTQESYRKASMVYTADGLYSVVQKGDIISSINQSAEAVTINASKIDLTGNLDLRGIFTSYGTSGSVAEGFTATLDNSSLKFLEGDGVQPLVGALGPYAINGVPRFGLQIYKLGENGFVTIGYEESIMRNLETVGTTDIGAGSSDSSLKVSCPATFKQEVHFEDNVFGVSGFQFYSDRRKKKSIKDLAIDKARSFIMGLKPCKYKFRKGISTSNRYHHGFIAQEVKEAMPEDWGVYIENKENDFIGLRYDEIIADLVKVVQDQEKRIESLEMEIKRAKEKSK